jgi:rubredoxin
MGTIEEKNSYIKANFKGGIVSIADLHEFLKMSKSIGENSISAGLRQELYVFCDNASKMINLPSEFPSLNLELGEDEFPNIVSSYAAEDIFTSHANWLTEGIYRDIMDSFDYQPSIKINICDNTQPLVPLFTGHLSFICSPYPNFWYLYVRHPRLGSTECWPELIYSTEVNFISKWMEQQLKELEEVEISILHKKLSESHKLITRKKDQDLVLPRMRFPYYEGMNAYQDGYWLGIFKRNFDYPIFFMEDLAALCDQTRISHLYLSSWRSLIIKGIKEQDRIRWEKLLGKHGINIRHSGIELNWQIEPNDIPSLDLKNFLVEQFNRRDIRTFGLSFYIGKLEEHRYSNVVITEGNKKDSYNLYYLDNFNPNGKHKKLYASDVKREDLSDSLEKLSKLYFRVLNADTESVVVEKSTQREIVKSRVLYQCKDCLTVYDEVEGEPERNVARGTLYALLPENWCCSLCEAPKKSYIQISSDVLIAAKK